MKAVGKSLSDFNHTGSSGNGELEFNKAQVDGLCKGPAQQAPGGDGGGNFKLGKRGGKEIAVEVADRDGSK